MSITATQQLADPHCVIVLLGNKNDLANSRKVTFEEVQQYAHSRGYLFFEVSAKTSHNVKEAMQMAVEQFVLGNRDPLLVQYT